MGIHGAAGVVEERIRRWKLENGDLEGAFPSDGVCPFPRFDEALRRLALCSLEKWLLGVVAEIEIVALILEEVYHPRGMPRESCQRCVIL